MPSCTGTSQEGLRLVNSEKMAGMQKPYEVDIFFGLQIRAPLSRSSRTIIYPKKPSVGKITKKCFKLGILC